MSLLGCPVLFDKSELFLLREVPVVVLLDGDFRGDFDLWVIFVEFLLVLLGIKFGLDRCLSRLLVVLVRG